MPTVTHSRTTSHPRHTCKARRHRQFRHYLPILLLLLNAPTTASPALAAQQLYSQICYSSISLMLSADELEAQPDSPVESLRSLTPQLSAQLTPSVVLLVQSMDTLYSSLQQGKDVPTVMRQDFYDKLLGTLHQVYALTPANQQNSPNNLPERLDYVLLLYIGHSQLGDMQPERTAQGNFLSQDIATLTKDIDRDLLQLGTHPGTAQSPLLRDTRSRWNYISRSLIFAKTTSPVPLSVLTHIRRISSNLRLMRADVSG